MMRSTLVATVVGVVLSAALTYPTIVHPASMARIDSGDGRFSVWNVAWVAHALLDQPTRLFDANIFYPHTGTLAWSEANLVAGALAVPVYAATRNPVAAHNSAVFLAFVLSFVAMFALTRRLTGSDGAALVAATTFTFAPFVAARTAHIQLLMVFVFPVVLLAFHRFVERPIATRGAVLGGALALAGLACGYYGIFAGLAVGWASAYYGVRRLRVWRYWAGLALAVVVAAALVAPAFQPYLALREEGGARQALDLDEARSYSADARAYVTSPARAHQWIIRLVGPGREVLFPGVVLSVLTLVGLMAAMGRARPEVPAAGSDSARAVVGCYAGMAAMAGWASFGPDAGLYAWLSDGLPFMSFLRAPARFGIVVAFAMSVIAAVGVRAWLPGRWPRLLPAMLVGLAAIEVSAAPWPLRQVPELPQAYRHLATLPRGPLVEFHFPYQPGDYFNHTRYMFWSTWHWQPLINGYSDYIPADFRAMTVPINGFPDAESFRILEARGARYVTLHRATYNDEAWSVLRARFPAYRQYLRPIVEDDEVWLYEIVDYPR